MERDIALTLLHLSKIQEIDAVMQDEILITVVLRSSV